MPKKTKCPTCGSRRWRKIADGQVVCEDGHVLQGVRSESQVMTEPSAHALQKRRILKGGERINKRKVYGRADKVVYHGRAAEWLRVQALQLLLRHQVAAVRKLWAVPDALEAIARDLWTYQLLISQMTPQPSSRSPSPVPPRRRKKSTRRSLAHDATTPTPSDGSDTARADAWSGSESESENESESDNDSDDNEELDPDLQALEDDDDPMASDDEGDEMDTGDGGPTTKPPKEPWKRTRPLRVSDVLATLALALYLLRVPFTFARLEALVNACQIPYVDFVQTTVLPADMVRHMDLGVRKSLRPIRCPPPASLYELTRSFVRILHGYFGMPIPEVNLPPVAWHVVSELGGNAHAYDQVVRLLELIDANMTITNTYNVGERKSRNSEGHQTFLKATRHFDVFMPELSVAAAWVVVMTLAYGLDGEPRLPLIKSDPLIGMPKMEDWVGELDRRLRSGAFKGTMRDMGALPFHDMGGDDIDRFLDRAEHVLLTDRDHGTGGAAFPLPRAPKMEPHNPNSWEAFHARAADDGVTQAKPPPRDTPNQELPLLPGEAVRVYGAAATLPRPLAIVVAAAAAVVGVEPEAVLDLAARFERRVERARPRPPVPKTLVARKLRSAVLRESRSLSSFGT